MNALLETPRIKIETTPIHKILLNIGMPPNLLGYSYIIYAAELMLQNPDVLHALTKELYVDIAKQYRTTPSRVERAIRNAISVTWLYGNYDFINKVFRNCIRPDKGTPTNSLFLSRIYYYISNMEAE